MPTDAYLPKDYVSKEELRLEAYRRLAEVTTDAPAPAAVLQPGPFVNPLWPNAEQEAARHKAHIVVIAPENPVANR